MMTKFGSRRMLLVVGLSLAAIVILFAFVINVSWRHFHDYDVQARRLEPKISRLMGVEQSQELLEQAGKKIELQLAAIAYPVVKDVETTGATMQRKVREVMTQAGMTVSGSKILPIRKKDGYDEIALDLTATGSMDAFANILKDLKGMAPIVIVENINIKPARKTRRNKAIPQNVLVQFKVFSLRLQP